MAIHTQRHSTNVGRRGLQESTTTTGAALSRKNTRPIRIKLDFESLYEATAPEHSTCFAVGQWFRRGLPKQQSPPPDGVETCVRGKSESLSHDGCWGKCRAYDIVSAADRDKLIAAVRVMAVSGPRG